MWTFLQFQDFKGLSQYGVLGIFCLAMIYIIWYMEKRRVERENQVMAENRELKARVLTLETKFESYQNEDKKSMMDLIHENISVMERVCSILDKQ